MRFDRPAARRPIQRTALALLLLLGGGCAKSLFLMNADKMKPVAAECDKLRGQKVAVVVWADQTTLDMDPFAQARAAQQIGYFLQLNRSREELKGLTLVEPDRVNRLQESLGVAGSTTPNPQIAEQLGADMLLRVDLFDYTTRAPEANGLIKGRVGGNLTVQRISQAEPLYRSEVSAEFPEGSRIGVLDRDDEEVLNETLRLFGERVAQKFHGHEVRYD